jgi:hypothetical protein
MDLTSLKRRALKFGLFGRLDDAARQLRFAGDKRVTLKLPNPNSEMGRLILEHPHPLIDPRSRMVVLYSAKSACTNVLIWFLHHLGHAEAARDYHGWPHQYRDHVYYQSLLYRQVATSRDLKTFTVVKVVRDPFKRVASSFRHVVRHSVLRDGIGRKLRDTQIEKHGLSFASFLDFLEATDLTRCNPHYSLQRHAIESKLRVKHLINVSKEDLFGRLNDVERDLGLPVTNLAQSPWVKKLEERHHQDDADLGDPESVYTQRLTREQALRGPWPSYDTLLTPTARERIAKLYAADIKAYF